MNGTAWNGYPMARRGSFLLSDGDVLALSPESQLMFFSDSCMEEENIDMVQQVEMEVSAFLCELPAGSYSLQDPGPQ